MKYLLIKFIIFFYNKAKIIIGYMTFIYILKKERRLKAMEKNKELKNQQKNQQKNNEQKKNNQNKENRE